MIKTKNYCVRIVKIFLVSAILFYLCLFINSSKALESNLRKTRPQIAKQTANTVQGRVDGVSSVSLEVSASLEEISTSSEDMSASTVEIAAASQTLTNIYIDT